MRLEKGCDSCVTLVPEKNLAHCPMCMNLFIFRPTRFRKSVCISASKDKHMHTRACACARARTHPHTHERKHEQTHAQPRAECEHGLRQGSKDRTRDDWHEQWGEKLDPSGHKLGCWAEMKGSNGFGENWIDQWHETYGKDGVGNKVVNKNRWGPNGSWHNSERYGEEWDSKRGWWQKGGETVHSGMTVSSWHQSAW